MIWAACKIVVPSSTANFLPFIVKEILFIITFPAVPGGTLDIFLPLQ
jgi:hypothetical protein